MTYVKAFEDPEFERRSTAVRHRMEGSGFDLLVCQDPANMNWLTGFDGWSFYTPQAVVVHRDEASPIWFGRAQDAGRLQSPPTCPRPISSRSPSRWFIIRRNIRSTSYAS